MKLDNFKVIYKILRLLEKSMDLEELDLGTISPQVLRLTEARWNSIMEMLAEEGYIKGLKVARTANGAVAVSVCSTRITLKGLEYLQDNSLMKKAADIARGVSDFIP